MTSTAPAVPDLQDLQQPQDFDRPSLIMPLVARPRAGLRRPALRPKARVKRDRASLGGLPEMEAPAPTDRQDRERLVSSFVAGLPTLPDDISMAMGQDGQRCRTLKPRLSR